MAVKRRETIPVAPSPYASRLNRYCTRCQRSCPLEYVGAKPGGAFPFVLTWRRQCPHCGDMQEHRTYTAEAIDPDTEIPLLTSISGDPRKAPR